MVKFNIKLDMTSIFEDERKYSMVMGDTDWPSIKSLRERIRELYNIDGVNFMTNDGFFLPLDECVDILKHCEQVRVLKEVRTLENTITPVSPRTSVNESRTDNGAELMATRRKRSYEEEENSSKSIQPVAKNNRNNENPPERGKVVHPPTVVFRCNLAEGLINRQPRVFPAPDNYSVRIELDSIGNNSSQTFPLRENGGNIDSNGFPLIPVNNEMNNYIQG